MDKKENLFGCFVSGPTVMYGMDETEQEGLRQKAKEFRNFIWGEKGIDSNLKELINYEYGNDISLILIKFYLLPLPIELDEIKQVENYSKKDKSIAGGVIVNDENFFLKNEIERTSFIRDSIFELIKLFSESKSLNKFDTRFDLILRELNNQLIA